MLQEFDIKPGSERRIISFLRRPLSPLHKEGSVSAGAGGGVGARECTSSAVNPINTTHQRVGHQNTGAACALFN